MTTQDTTAVYRACLADALSDAQFNQGQIDSCLEKFDKIADTGASETAFRVIHEAYASGDTEKSVKTIKAVIQEALEAAKKFNVEKNPVVRVRKVVERLNALIDKAAVTIDGKEMTRQELDAAKLAVPKWAKVQTEYALASERTKPRFGVTVTY